MDALIIPGLSGYALLLVTLGGAVAFGSWEGSGVDPEARWFELATLVLLALIAVPLVAIVGVGVVRLLILS